MPERVLRVVANPPTLFWAPEMLVMGNFAIVANLFIFNSAFNFPVGPLWPFFLLFANHIILAMFTAKEPHLTNCLQAWSLAQKPTANLIKMKKGKKFVA
ncbi:MAG: hypothetical protein AB7G80_06375 [Dongiaceae bacterium]